MCIYLSVDLEEDLAEVLFDNGNSCVGDTVSVEIIRETTEDDNTHDQPTQDVSNCTCMLRNTSTLF